MFKDVLLKDRKIVFSFVAVLSLWGLSALIAICASDAVLDRHNVLRHFVMLQQLLFPIERWSMASHFYQVTLLCNSILVCSIPFYGYISWRYVWTRSTGLIAKPRLAIKDRVALIISALFLALLFVGLWRLFESQDTRLFKFSTSKVDLALYGSAVFGWMAFFLVTLVAILVRLIKP